MFFLANKYLTLFGSEDTKTSLSNLVFNKIVPFCVDVPSINILLIVFSAKITGKLASGETPYVIGSSTNIL